MLGGFNGKVGSVIGSSWKGINYMRAKSSRSNRKVSEKQMQQRAKFMFAANFLQPLYAIIQVGFRKLEIQQSAKNAAMSDLMNYTIEGDYPSYSVNFRNLKLSKGSLQIPQGCTVELQGDKAVYNWTMDSGSEDDQQEDKLALSLSEDNMILVTLADGFSPRYTLRKYKRKDLTGELGLPNAPAGTEVHCYLACASTAEHRTVSNTVYIGTVTIP
ncbi:DUF6266 family protein [Labilibacter marinus]|uniref:DUF6266 family protein n=1 Tax=Labilibacter marinus TaxID=1477105 RepID=UPI0021D04C79|nr:DUF6266 family protein [Labilibacter marinus]